MAPRDYVTYCQVQRLSGYTSPRGECVCFNLEDSAPPEVEEDYLPFSWSNSKWAHLVHCKKIFNFELELLTSLWQALLGIHCSAMVHNCLATVHNCSVMVHNYSVTHHGGWTMSPTTRLCSHLLGQAQNGVAQRIQGAQGLAMGGTTSNTHDRLHGLRPQGWSSPQDKALWSRALLDMPLRDLLGYV